MGIESMFNVIFGVFLYLYTVYTFRLLEFKGHIRKQLYLSLLILRDRAFVSVYVCLGRGDQTWDFYAYETRALLLSHILAQSTCLLCSHLMETKKLLTLTMINSVLA